MSIAKLTYADFLLARLPIFHETVKLLSKSESQNFAALQSIAKLICLLEKTFREVYSIFCYKEKLRLIKKFFLKRTQKVNCKTNL